MISSLNQKVVLVSLVAAMHAANAFMSLSTLPGATSAVRSNTRGTSLLSINHDGDDMFADGERRRVLDGVAAAGLAWWTSLLVDPVHPSEALVKGNAPPPKKSAASSDKPKCTNVEECQAMAEQREQELRENQELGPPPKITSSGTRYRDIDDGTGDEVKDGDEVQVFFKVLKLGKRSYDGLSGEGTVVFSRGTFRLDRVSPVGVGMPVPGGGLTRSAPTRSRWCNEDIC